MGESLSPHPDAVATIGVRRVDDVTGHDVVVLGRDGRVVGYQRAPHPAEALSDLVYTGERVLAPSAYEYGDPTVDPGGLIVALLEHDVPVYAVVLE
jgi:NDP-sugar pyrophosphorylase family protein